MRDVSIFSLSRRGRSSPDKHQRTAHRRTPTRCRPTNTPGSQPTNTPTKTPVAPTATPTPSVGGLPLTGNRIQWLGKDWYLHGANLPWYNWSCDFGCNGNGGVSSNAVKNAIEPVLTSAANAGMTNIRWWMFPGDPWQITTNANGTPTGINNAVFADIDAALALAEKHDLYYTFVLFSGPDGLPREWMTDSAKRTALANVLGTQLFRRYANNPHILSWEIMNEPEWKIWSGDYTQAEVVNTVKAIAAQANAETTSYVTVGSAMLDGLEMWTGAGLDYYEAHWYDYMAAGRLVCLLHRLRDGAGHLQPRCPAGDRRVLRWQRHQPAAATERLVRQGVRGRLGLVALPRADIGQPGGRHECRYDLRRQPQR